MHTHIILVLIYNFHVPLSPFVVFDIVRDLSFCQRSSISYIPSSTLAFYFSVTRYFCVTVYLNPWTPEQFLVICFIYMWASALCIRSTIIRPLLTEPQQFHYCTDSNPGTEADDAFVLTRGVWRNATWPSHSRKQSSHSQSGTNYNPLLVDTEPWFRRGLW